MAFSDLVMISLCGHMLTCVVCTPVQRLCPVGQYLDVGTGSCRHCSEICDMADMQGTQQFCQITCPGYHTINRSDVRAEDKTKKKQELCPHGSYLDDVTLRCESCTALCTEEKLNQCKKKCPGYEEQASTNLSRERLSIILWTLTATLVCILVVLVVAIIVKCRSTRPTEFWSHGQRENARIILPYIYVKEEKPQQRIDQWLSLLHTRAPDTESDSRYSSRTSLIYNPMKPKA